MKKIEVLLEECSFT